MCALSTLLTQGNSGANSSLHFAELAQLVERRLAKAKVAGSNPVFRSKKMGPAVADFESAPGPCFSGFRAAWHILGTWRGRIGEGSALSVGAGSSSSGARRSSFA